MQYVRHGIAEASSVANEDRSGRKAPAIGQIPILAATINPDGNPCLVQTVDQPVVIVVLRRNHVLARVVASFEVALRYRNGIEQARPGHEGKGHGHAPHSHLQRQRPSGVVVRRLGRTAGIDLAVGINLAFHHIHQVSPEWLRTIHDERSGRVGDAVGHEIILGLMHVDARGLEKIQHPGRRARIALIGRHQPRKRRLAEPLLDGVAPHVKEVPLQFLMVARGVGQEAHDRREFVVHDVAQPPPPSRPRLGEVGRDLIRRESPGAAAQLALALKDGAGKVDARRLGQDADHVVPIDRRAESPRPPVVIDRTVDDSRPAAAREFLRHVSADDHERVIDQRGNVGVLGIVKRRDEKPRAPVAHLVNVVDDRRAPVFVDQLGRVARLAKIQHEPVAVVVVTGVLLIDPRHPGPFPRPADRRLIPIHDHVQAVGVGRGDEQEDHPLQDLRDPGRIARGEVIEKIHRHLRRRNFRGVQAAVDQDHDFGFLGQFALCRDVEDQARIGDHALVSPMKIDVFDRAGRGDLGVNHRQPFGRLADMAHVDPVRGPLDQVKILDNALPPGELVIGADAVTEEFFRSPGRLSARRGRPDQDGGQPRARHQDVSRSC